VKQWTKKSDDALGITNDDAKYGRRAHEEVVESNVAWDGMWCGGEDGGSGLLLVFAQVSMLAGCAARGPHSDTGNALTRARLILRCRGTIGV
jgi:hypothetical protein